jgi:ATP-binding cassette subfamily D (ALD) protein 4
MYVFFFFFLLFKSFVHVRLRQFAESIAFTRGEEEENQRATSSLDTLLCHQRGIVNKQLPLQRK